MNPRQSPAGLNPYQGFSDKKPSVALEVTGGGEFISAAVVNVVLTIAQPAGACIKKSGLWLTRKL
jgi:hypothetical protein